MKELSVQSILNFSLPVLLLLVAGMWFVWLRHEQFRRKLAMENDKPKPNPHDDGPEPQDMPTPSPSPTPTPPPPEPPKPE